MYVICRFLLIAFNILSLSLIFIIFDYCLSLCVPPSVGHSGAGSGSQGLWRTKMISSVAEIKEDRDKVARET